jgi:tetratricopeptide (TPR) repeat protein
MLPPSLMLATKNRIRRGAIVFFALAIFISGCTPPGPRALLKGKKLLARGDYADAVAELKTATTILPASAPAWNYLGVACQHAGQPADAATAYERALTLDRDLVEAHYNLGCLWLEQNKFDSAKTEFTAYTLRRSNTPEGWLKLGMAQLRGGEIALSEKSFSTALSLSPNNAEALNGLGLARIQRGRPQEAAQFFAAASADHPDYAPAILNLAAVEQEYLRDNKSALQHYRAYLALTPRPEKWDEVNAIVNSFGQPAMVAVASPPSAGQSPVVAPAPPVAGEIKTQNVPHPATSPRTQPPVRGSSNPPPRATIAPQVVRVQPAPAIVTPHNPAVTAEPVVEMPAEPEPQKPSVWHKLNPARWFGSSAPEKKFDENGVTPLPPPDSVTPANSAPLLPADSAPTSAPAPVPLVVAKPIHIVQPAPPVFPRYLYLSPRRPKPGNRAAASGAFTQAKELEQTSRWTDAMELYRQAASLDPGWFEAQYNFGVLAYRLQDYRQALAVYETALAIRPDSVDARYNFALTLKAAGYAMDAANELEKILSANPDEVRAHLALGNLCAQQFHDTARARRHYLKVLELDPHNSQATDIRFWLAQNPP